jgi:hypothetical protein
MNAPKFPQNCIYVGTSQYCPLFSDGLEPSVPSGTPQMFASFIHQWLCSPLLGPGHSFTFVILYTVGRTPWTGNRPVARPLPTHRTAQTQNKRRHSCLKWDSNPFEPTIPAFERTKAVHASERHVSGVSGNFVVSMLDNFVCGHFHTVGVCVSYFYCSRT